MQVQSPREARLSPLPHHPSPWPCFPPHCENMCLQPPRRDQHEGMCCPGASGQDGPVGEDASKESSGIWEGKQRCASAAGQATLTQPSFPAARVRCSGPPAESWPLLSVAADFLRPALTCGAWPSLGKRLTLSSMPLTSTMGLCLSLDLAPLPTLRFSFLHKPYSV